MSLEIKVIKTPGSSHMIHFPDCDPYGHLNNSKYLDYFWNARMEHLIKQFDFNALKFRELGIGWVVASQEIFYLKPAMVYENVYIHSSVLLVEDNRMVLELAMFNHDKTQLKSIMWSVLFPIDIATGKRSAFTGDLRQFLEANLNDEIDFNAGIQERIKKLKEVKVR